MDIDYDDEKETTTRRYLKVFFWVVVYVIIIREQLHQISTSQCSQLMCNHHEHLQFLCHIFVSVMLAFISHQTWKKWTLIFFCSQVRHCKNKTGDDNAMMKKLLDVINLRWEKWLNHIFSVIRSINFFQFDRL